MLEKLISLFAPLQCIGCEAENDRLLCQNCRQMLVPMPSRCYRCHAATETFQTCRACRPATVLSAVYVATPYENVAKNFVHRIKYERAQAGVREMGEMVAALLQNEPAVVLAHIPTASSRVRARGYDHAKLLVRQLAIRAGLPRATLLARIGQAHQVGANRTTRLKQLHGAFRPRRHNLIRGRHIILVDDVLTTGATLETAAKVLKRAGAAKVSAVVFAQA